MSLTICVAWVLLAVHGLKHTANQFFFVHFYVSSFNICEITSSWKVWKSDVPVQWIETHQKRLCGRLSLIVYSLVVIIPAYGVLEGLLSLILKKTIRTELTFAYIELRMYFLSSISPAIVIASFYLRISNPSLYGSSPYLVYFYSSDNFLKIQIF